MDNPTAYVGLPHLVQGCMHCALGLESRDTIGKQDKAFDSIPGEELQSKHSSSYHPTQPISIVIA